MRLLNFEPGPAVYRADFLLYATTLAFLGLALLTHPLDGALLGWVAAGVAAWTLLEYLLHRFVLHGLSPFRDWHAEHHSRPGARISAPTLLTACLFTLLLLPMGWWLGRCPAMALPATPAAPLARAAPPAGLVRLQRSAQARPLWGHECPLGPHLSYR